jgi:radical SAM superfamily enzyme YgiQ (UPF0313 family)
MYRDKKFRIRPWEEFVAHGEALANSCPRPERVFLADGNCLALDTAQMLKTLVWVRKKFPGLRRITSYAGPKDILGKTPAELREIREAGLAMLYMGIESGSDAILNKICKGVSAAEMMEAGQLAREAGFKLSVTVISGMGGTSDWQEHAVESARVVSTIDPDYLGLLTLMLRPGTLLYRQVEAGKFQVPGPQLVAEETMLLLENLEVSKCVFRSNHASNYLPLAGNLPADQARLVASIKKVLAKEGISNYKPEALRRL